MRNLPVGLVLLSLGPVDALRRAPAAAVALEAEEDVSSNFGTDANATTKFLFLTHHKTGTNLMQQLCNLTAKFLSDGKERCHWCSRAMGLHANGSMRCPPDNEFRHGAERGTAGRFTLVSNVDIPDIKRLRAWAPDYRAVHMSRDPVKMLVSDYGYNVGLYKKNKTGDLYDATVNRSVYEGNTSMDDMLRNDSYMLSHYVDHMCKVQKLTKDDPHIVQMDLDFFKSNYTQAAQQLFSFLFGAQYPRMKRLMVNASAFDMARNKNFKKDNAFVSDKSHGETSVVEKKVRELMQAGDKMVVASTSCQGAEEARPWAGQLRHYGSSLPLTASEKR